MHRLSIVHYLHIDDCSIVRRCCVLKSTGTTEVKVIRRYHCREYFNNWLFSFHFRRYADQSIDIFLKTLYLPMATTELLLMGQTGDTFLYVYIFIYLLILIPHVTTTVRDCLTNLLVLLHFCLALLLSFSSKLDHDDKYWLWHFLCLFVLNHFCLPQISRKFSIPLTDLSSLSLLFLNIFLINSFAWSRMSMKEKKTIEIVVVISCWFTKNIQREEETKKIRAP